MNVIQFLLSKYTVQKDHIDFDLYTILKTFSILKPKYKIYIKS